MSLNSSFEPQEEVMSEINMTPLVDVMLVLLIIFILAMPVLTQHLNVELPRADANPAPIKAITLTVQANHTVRWDNTEIDSAQLATQLQQLAQSPDAAVQIAADRAVAFEQVAQVLATVQSSGIRQVAILTQAN